MLHSPHRTRILCVCLLCACMHKCVYVYVFAHVIPIVKRHALEKLYTYNTMSICLPYLSGGNDDKGKGPICSVYSSRHAGQRVHNGHSISQGFT